MSERGAEDRAALEKRLDERFTGSDRYHEGQLSATSTAMREILKAEVARIETMIHAAEKLSQQRSKLNKEAVRLAVETSRNQWRVTISIGSVLIAAATIVITFVTMITRH